LLKNRFMINLRVSTSQASDDRPGEEVIFTKIRLSSIPRSPTCHERKTAVIKSEVNIPYNTITFP
jgi:hypothetical protein